MSRTLKRILAFLGALALLLILFVAAIFLFVDPKDYQGRIADRVRQSTGRELAIEGDMRLSLFPSLGLVLEQIALSNPPGMQGSSFAKASSLRVSVSLLPLLKKHLEITELTLQDLELHLVRLEDGTATWAFSSGPATGAAPEGPAPGLQALPPGLSVAAVSLRNTSVIFDDRRSGTSFRVHRLRLTADHLSPGQPSEVDLSFVLESPRHALEAAVDFSSRVDLAGDLMACTAQDTRFEVRASGEDIPGGQLDLELAATLELDLEKHRIRADDLRASLDETALEGAFDLRDFSLPAAVFDLRLGRLNLDRYLGGGSGHAPAPANASDFRDDAPAVPPALRTLDLEGRVRAKEIQAAGLAFEDVDIQVNARDGLLRVEPVHATLCGGKIQVRTALDVRGDAALPAALSLCAEQVHVGPVVRALTGEEKMTGTADVDLDVRTRGLEIDAWLTNLNGPGSFAVRNGTVSFFGVPQDARNKDFSTFNPFQVSDSRTPFDLLQGSVTAREGLVTNQDLRFQSPSIQTAGRGRVDLRRRSVDYDLEVILSYLPDVSVRIVGPLSAPSVRVQPLKMLQRSVEGLGKGAMDVPEKMKEGVQGVGEGVIKLPGSIGDTFKGLFGGKD